MFLQFLIVKILVIQISLVMKENLVEGRDAEERIVKGMDAVKERWQFITVINIKKVFTCGGSLIRPKWVLTAGHCIEGEEIRAMQQKFKEEIMVRLGTQDLVYKRQEKVLNAYDLTQQEYRYLLGKSGDLGKRDDLDQSNKGKSGDFLSLITDTENIYKIEKKYVHPKFQTQKISVAQFAGNDMALLKLATPSQKFPVASLPTKKIDMDSTCVSAGWGLKDYGTNYEVFDKNKLQQILLNVMKNEECTQVFDVMKSSTGVSKSMDELQRLHKICCSNFEEGHIFPGDSGGPLLCNDELHGVVSQFAALEGIRSYKVSIFTRTTPYVDWMSDIFVQNGEEPIPDNVLRSEEKEKIKSNVILILFLYTSLVFLK